MVPVNFRSFRKKLSIHRKSFRSFLHRMEKNPPKNIDKLTPLIDAEVWKEVDCLSCANCCKKMTPTFTEKDLKRIAAHLNETVDVFKKKWLKKQDGDYVNVLQPCQVLDLKTNMCNIYEVRPDDCAGFPHLPKRKFSEYAHVLKQNIEFCPATYKMVEKLKAIVEG